MSKLLFCSFALVLMYPLGIDLYLVGLPRIADDLQASEVVLHTAFSIYLAGMATTMLVAGWLADKIGRKPVALIGASIFALSSLLAAYVTNADAFLASRFFQGIGAGFCNVVTYAILRDALNDEQRAKVLSMINGIVCIVPVLAPVLGHFILLRYEWPSLFITQVITATVIGLACLFLLKETKGKATAKPDQQPLASQPLAQESLISPLFISRLMISALGVTAILTYVNASPFLLMNSMGFTTGQYSTAMAALAGVSMATSFSAPKLLTLWGQKRMVITAMILFIVSGSLIFATTLGLLPNPISLIGFALICAGFSMGFGSVMSQALSPFSQRAGVASSVLGICQVSFSAGYISIMGGLGFSAETMLTSLLIFTGIISIILMLVIPFHQNTPKANNHEQATASS
ncbi:multidrug transporter MdtL [Photobacterium sanctipauli]|uniref:Multidrug transporter MdtL n=1 Tax=Photobacterium sanctipauli TaxID=1342794 RepID=A0A2T3NWD2_9GAMM|nr:MFS transporter [Photobacterium sanctipauli]PSW20607.1 multidrug transporter MdtL [Photobacterium sanctipauli]